MTNKEKSELEMTLEITDIKDWLIGNPHGDAEIELHGKLENNGVECAVDIQIPITYRKAAKSIGLPFEYNADLQKDAISRDIIGKKYILKIYEK